MYGNRHSNTIGALDMRKSLGSNGVFAIFHGHIHDTLPTRYLPNQWNNESSFVACGSLSGYCQNSVNKFNMVELTNFQNIKDLSLRIKCYDVNSFGDFSIEKSHELHRNVMNNFLVSMNS